MHGQDNGAFAAFANKTDATWYGADLNLYHRMTEKLIMTTITLCQLDDITDGGALGLPEHQQLHPAGLAAVRQGAQVWVYINRCPHFSVPLDYRPQEFCTYRGKILMCAHHSAMFRFEDGHCIDGPCKESRLESVPVRWVENNLVMDVVDAPMTN